MIDGTPKTGKSTLYAIIFRVHNEKKKLYVGLSVCMENNFEIVVCVPWWMTLPVPENQPYAVIFR